MKKIFENRLAAIDWIATNVEDESTFELLREQLNYNFIYTGTYYLDLDETASDEKTRDQEFFG